jgi:hypothetical protein
VASVVRIGRQLQRLERRQGPQGSPVFALEFERPFIRAFIRRFQESEVWGAIVEILPSLTVGGCKDWLEAEEHPLHARKAHLTECWFSK